PRRPPEATSLDMPQPLLFEQLLLLQRELALDPGAPLGFFHPKPILTLARLFLAYAAGLFVAGPLLDLRLGTPLRLRLRHARIGLRLHPFVLESAQLLQ